MYSYDIILKYIGIFTEEPWSNLFTNSGVILGDTSMRMDSKAAKRFPLAGMENHLYLVWRIPRNPQRKEVLKKITDVIIQIFHKTYDKTL